MTRNMSISRPVTAMRRRTALKTPEICRPRSSSPHSSRYYNPLSRHFLLSSFHPPLIPPLSLPSSISLPSTLHFSLYMSSIFPSSLASLFHISPPYPSISPPLSPLYLTSIPLSSLPVPFLPSIIPPPLLPSLYPY